MSPQDHEHDDHLPEGDAALLAQALTPHEPAADRAAQMKAKILRGIAAGQHTAAAPAHVAAQEDAAHAAAMAASPEATATATPAAPTSPTSATVLTASAALTVRVHERQWRQVARGVEMCTLHEDEHSRSVLLRMQPESFLLPHRHTMSEESILLEGDAIIGENLNLKAGDFHFSPAGALHPLLQSPSGCIVFVRGEKGFRPRVTLGLFKRMLQGFSARSSN